MTLTKAQVIDLSSFLILKFLHDFDPSTLSLPLPSSLLILLKGIIVKVDKSTIDDILKVTIDDTTMQEINELFKGVEG